MSEHKVTSAYYVIRKNVKLGTNNIHFHKQKWGIDLDSLLINKIVLRHSILRFPREFETWGVVRIFFIDLSKYVKFNEV